MLTKGDKMIFIDDIYLTDKLDRTILLTTTSLKNNKGVYVKGEESFRVKLANKGSKCTFVEKRPNGKIRVAFKALSGTFIEGDVKDDEAKPLIVAGV